MAWFDWFYIKNPTYQLRTSVLVWEVISKVIPINFVSIAWLINKKYTLKANNQKHIQVISTIWRHPRFYFESLTLRKGCDVRNYAGLPSTELPSRCSGLE